MNGLKLMGSISLIFGIILLLLPLLSTPVVKGLSFWRAVFEIDDLKVEVKTGFWGACTYYQEIHDGDEPDLKIGKKTPKLELDKKGLQVKCTKAKAGYSFRMSSTVPDAAGELSSTQTLFLFWLLLAACLALIALALSFSPNYYQWKHAAIVALTSSVLAFGTFLACVVIFTGLTRETRLTESAKTIPLYGGLQGCTFFPLSACILLGIGAGLLWMSFRQEFFKLHRRSSQADVNRMNLKSETLPNLPPATLGNDGISRDEWVHKPVESRHGTEIARDAHPSRSLADDEVSEEASLEYELDDDQNYHQQPTENGRDTEAQSEYSMFQSDSLGSASFSYLHPFDGLPPPPPLQPRRSTRTRPANTK
ncbi:hypothetical protein PSTG_03953 [Puccinia striiformis f. sp. tritici PST-78]|uniref:Uncharacterized protein n=1 Tax=Puccinia striiformis f. sp. tritici PST-78 TaxID=1165861 RepID=A0A0L0VUP8_9BASI|nr:hypothetical protein PSTG_03953 [Puccinia striiformis f. sp. tritici PST-78]